MIFTSRLEARLTVITLLLFCSIGLKAQTITANVNGTVTDPSGAVIAGAKVTAKAVETNVATSAITNKDGVYNIRFLQIGHYTVTIEAPGFAVQTYGPFTLEVDQNAKVDGHLVLAGSQQQVAIQADIAPLLNTENPTLTARDRIQGLQGRAGSGKTSVLATIREGAEQNGYAVEGFAPTSRAAKQLRDAGINADTLQRFLAGGGLQAAGDPASKHLYMVDESSLASTQQIRDFLNKIGPQDKVLLIGDTRQHQGVDAGKPFEQLQEAGMRTAQLDQIMRQKDLALLKAVEHLSNNETAIGVEMLSQQGRITEIVDPQERIAAIAKSYAERPENTLVVSPDNASRRAINQAVRQELQALGVVNSKDHSMRVLTPRNDMTGADREWASRYEAGDVLHYTRGSKEHGIESRSYARVVSTNPKENLVTVQKQDGQQVTYDPSRLCGIAAYREIEREFATGDKVQFTAPSRNLQVANRDLATIQHIGNDRKIRVRMEGAKDRIVRFDADQMRHFDHGYAVTSHSSQGLTSKRVLVNMDTEVHPDLMNSRFAYVSVSRASHDAQIYTNSAASLALNLSHDVTKSSAISIESTNAVSRGMEHRI